MFTDFAGFSTISQGLESSEVASVLNFYFSELIPIIKKHGGFPDKFIGDAIVAIFGAPVRFEDHAVRAVECAVELQNKIREINDRRRQAGDVIFEMRLGLNSGPVLVGAIGCDLKLEYTSIGETTNLANRMESNCKIGHIMISENTHVRITDHAFPEVYLSQTPEQEIVKGYEKPVETY